MQAVMSPSEFIEDPARNFIIVFFVAVYMSNGNGDPNKGGDPRVLPDRRGLINFTRQRRIIRNFWNSVLGLPIIVDDDRSLNTKLAEHENIKSLTGEYIDALFYGNPGVSKHLPKGTGPLSDEFLISEHPVHVLPIRGTRKGGYEKGEQQAVRDEDGKAMIDDEGHYITENVLRKDVGTMHTRHVVRLGLYRGMTTYNALKGQRMGITPEDLDQLFQAIAQGMEHDHSTNRGNVYLRGAVQFVWPNHRFLPGSKAVGRCVQTELRGGLNYPESIEDYQIKVSDGNLPEGFDVLVFDHEALVASLRAAAK